MADVVDRPMAVARCNHCAWQAQCTGDDMVEVVDTLRQILIRHVRDDHPDQDHTGRVVFRPLGEKP